MCEDIIVSTASGNLGCKLWGENVPETRKFIAIHGHYDNAASFDPLLEHFLEKDRSIACLDLPGHGLSYHLPDGMVYSNAFMVQAVRSLARELGWTEFHLIGHGYGAWVAEYFTLWWPQDVLSLTYIDAMIIPLDYYSPQGNSMSVEFARMVDKCQEFCVTDQVEKEYSWEELTANHMALTAGVNQEDCDVLMKRGAQQLDNGKYVYRSHAGVQFNCHSVTSDGLTEDLLLTALESLKNTPQLYIHATDMNYKGIREDVNFQLLLQKLQINLPKRDTFRWKASHPHATTSTPF